MKKFVLFLFSMLLAMCGCSVTPPAVPPPVPSHEVMAASLRDRVVALVAEARDGETHAYCSGVWVSETEILTANHCVDEEVAVKYAVYNDVFPGLDKNVPSKLVYSRPALVLKRDVEHDLAVLSASRVPVHTIAPIYAGYATPGMGVQALGQPLGLWFSYSSGEVAAVRFMESVMGVEMFMIQSTVPISPGSSGGGLFTESGEVLGITHGAYTQGENVNIFIDVRYVRALLSK